MNNELFEVALHMHAKGINCIPIGPQKIPTCKTWRDLQQPVSVETLRNVWNSGGKPDRIAIAAGRIKCLDIDLKVFKQKQERTEFKKKILTVFEKSGLDAIRERCLVQETQSYGLHMVWTSDTDLRSVKLAKVWTGEKYEAVIETRGHGGYFLAAPSAGYEIQRGSFEELPHLTEEEETLILDACRSLNEEVKQVVCNPVKSFGDGLKPGDDFNKRGTIDDILYRHGWQNVFANKWRRPGKDSGISASLGHCTNDKGEPLFYVFSSNAAPFENEKSYSSFAVYAMLEHGGDFASAAKVLGEQGYGDSLPEKKTTPERNHQSAAESFGLNEPEPMVKKIEFPEMVSLCDFPDDIDEQIEKQYPVIVDGLIHQKTKIVLGGGSKSFKSWCLMDLCLSVANGGYWLGRKCQQMPTLYINMELKHLFAFKRIKRVEKEKLYLNEIDGTGGALMKVWNLRGVCYDLAIIAQRIKQSMDSYRPGLIVIDPIYKCLGDRDENASRDMNALMDLIERLIDASDAAVVFGAHYSKGNQSNKEAMDRISGSGVFARDPDTILPMTRHEDDGCFVIEPILRNFPPVEPFVIEWKSPCFRVVEKDPAKLKKPGAVNKVSADRVLGALKGVMTREEWRVNCEKMDICKRSTFLKKVVELIDDNKVKEVSSGLYEAVS